MATKLFKIGECAYYGKWHVTISPNVITVAGIDWHSNKVEEQRTFGCLNAKTELNEYIHNQMDSYHAEKILKWITAHAQKDLTLNM